MKFQNIGHISSQEEEKHHSSLYFSVSTHKIESEIELRQSGRSKSVEEEEIARLLGFREEEEVQG